MSSQRCDSRRYTGSVRGRLAIRVSLCCYFAAGGSLCAAAVADAQAPVAPVTASFTFSPDPAMVGENVTFTSTSTATGDQNAIAQESWDLNADGVFADATGPQIVTQFASAGQHRVTLRVTDTVGDTSDATQVVIIADPPPATTAPPVATTPPATVQVVPAPVAPVVVTPKPFLGGLLSPYPVVRIVGRASGRDTTLSLLAVTAPPSATLTMSCRGGGCPFRHRQAQRFSGAKRGSGPAGTRTIRIRTFAAEPLDRGARISIYVTDPLRWGKYTSATMRSGEAPRRVDRCTSVGKQTVIRCPEQPPKAG